MNFWFPEGRNKSYPYDGMEKFLEDWRAWVKQYPRRWKLVTLTGRPNHDDFYQLRLWEGEPHSFRPDYVDSMGKNLVAAVSGISRRQLQHLVELLLKGHKAERTAPDMVEVWRLCE